MRRLLLEDVLLIAALQSSRPSDWQKALQEAPREDALLIARKNVLDWAPSKEEAS